MMFPKRMGRFDRGARPVGVALLLVLAACRQIVGFDDGPSTRIDGSVGEGNDAGSKPALDAAHDAYASPDGLEPAVDGGTDAEAGPYMSRVASWTFEDPICGACVDRSCADAATACAVDSSCTLYEACVASCGRDQSCAAHCMHQVPSSSRSQESWDLNQCISTRCPEACPASVVTFPNSHKTCGLLFGSAECISCCCDEFSACDNDPGCEPSIACSRQCQTGDPIGLTCLGECTGKPGVPYSDSANNAGSCATGRCSGACQAGDWSCLGKVEVPQYPSAGTWKLYGTVEDLSNGPVANFRVRVCPFGADSMCRPLDEEVTNASGDFIVDLDKIIAPSGFPFSVYFEVTAPAGLDYPTYLFFLPPWSLTHSVRNAFVVYTRKGLGNVTGDPNYGGVLFLAHDCVPSLGVSGGAGIHVTADPPSATDPVGYVNEGLQLDPAATSTFPYGVGFILNVPPGRLTLTATREATQQIIGKTQLWIRPDTSTVVDLAPTP